MPTRESRVKSPLFASLTCCVAISLTTSCMMVSKDEVARVSSPSGAVDAVIVETNGGAMASFGYEVFVIPTGKSTWMKQNVAFLYGAVRNEQAYGVNLRWDSSSDLAIEYLEARQEDLLTPAVSVGGEQVRVTLRSGINDPAAPPGGMLYNLNGRPHG